jgi:hypothetical protein
MPKWRCLKSNPDPLCYLCFLLFNFSLIASVGPRCGSNAWLNRRPQRQRRFGAPRFRACFGVEFGFGVDHGCNSPMQKWQCLKSNPDPLCYLCFLLFNFSLVASVGRRLGHRGSGLLRGRIRVRRRSRLQLADAKNGHALNPIQIPFVTFASFCSISPSVQFLFGCFCRPSMRPNAWIPNGALL